jgi:hypothetical protein
MIQVAAIFLFAKRKRKRKNGKGVKRVAARNNWWPEMNARKASNCTAMYGGQGSHLSQAASVFSDTDLTLGSSVGLFSQYIRAVCRQ